MKSRDQTGNWTSNQHSAIKGGSFSFGHCVIISYSYFYIHILYTSNSFLYFIFKIHCIFYSISNSFCCICSIFGKSPLAKYNCWFQVYNLSMLPSSALVKHLFSSGGQMFTPPPPPICSGLPGNLTLCSIHFCCSNKRS